MANKTTSKTTKATEFSDMEKPDLFTLEGYIDVFDTCENDSAVFSKLSPIGEDIDDDIWKDFLREHGHIQRAKLLLLFWDKIYANTRVIDENDRVKYIEIFSLLENVFRNVLLRPYIPAYRAINKHSGRYSSFVTQSDESLFKNLNFDDTSNNFLIYKGTDPIQTIIYAISCNIFWHVLSMKINKPYPSSP